MSQELLRRRPRRGHGRPRLDLSFLQESVLLLQVSEAGLAHNDERLSDLDALEGAALQPRVV